MTAAARPAPDPAIAPALARGTASLPKHEDRPQQRDMAEAVGAAIKQRRHLIVQAGTGTGKSLAYLVPALALGTRVVVSTATKALQDQLAHRDLPQLSRSLGVRFHYAVLKGRSNYVCRQRVEELSGGRSNRCWDKTTRSALAAASARSGVRCGGWSRGRRGTGPRARTRLSRAIEPSWRGSRRTRRGRRSAPDGENARE